MQEDTGEIRRMEDWHKRLNDCDLKKLVPFEEGEIVEIKGCRFKVLNVHCHPDNVVRLRGIPKNEGEQ